MAEQSVVETEVTGLIALSGLMLVFLPFFLDRLRTTGEKLPTWWIRFAQRLTWLTALLVVFPATASLVGLLTLWKVTEASGLLAWLTVATIASLVGYTTLTVWLENSLWKK